MGIGLALGGCATSNPGWTGSDDAAGADLTSAADDLATGGDNPDLAGTPPPPDLLQPPDLLPPLKGPGEACAKDADCVSKTCRPLGEGGAGMCLLPCKAQADCAGIYESFCEAATPNGTAGFCVPPSPYHCSTCKVDSDCGVFTERCLIAPLDNTAACHIDCALAGAAACPTDYACTAVTDGGAMRKLCLPKSPTTCLDAIGGFCTRVSLPQSCSRTNAAGTCVGQRVCLAASGRYDKCSALGPQYKMKCSDLDPPGCMVAYAPGAANDKNNCGTCGAACAAGQDCCSGACKPLNTVQNCGVCGAACVAGQDCCSGACTALNTVQNCGACGNLCPGVGQPTADVTCKDPATKLCDLTCKGENYDVNKSAADGCELLHPTPPGHTQATAADRGGKPCDDGGSRDTFSNSLLSDARVHQNPAVTSFSGTVGSAPDVWHVRASGGTFCINDYDVTLTTTGGGGTACYKLTFQTNKTTATITVNGNGSGNTNNGGGSGSYSDGSDIYFTVEKICSLPIQEKVNYTVSYHL